LNKHYAIAQQQHSVGGNATTQEHTNLATARGQTNILMDLKDVSCHISCETFFSSFS
jgi:hypothetical protein